MFNTLQRLLDSSRALDFLAPLALRLFLAPIFWIAGSRKLSNMEGTIQWFGNSEWGLGLPLPWLMAWLATTTELLGAVMLLVGLGVRWVSIPLMVTMVVAAVTVHLQHGWLAIAEKTNTLFASKTSIESAQRMSEFLTWLEKTHPDKYSNLTELGTPVMLNNGVEFAATYFIMLLVLFFLGGGRFFSLDYYMAKVFKPANPSV